MIPSNQQSSKPAVAFAVTIGGQADVGAVDTSVTVELLAVRDDDASVGVATVHVDSHAPCEVLAEIEHPHARSRLANERSVDLPDDAHSGAGVRCHDSWCRESVLSEQSDEITPDTSVLVTSRVVFFEIERFIGDELAGGVLPLARRRHDVGRPVFEFEMQFGQHARTLEHLSVMPQGRDHAQGVSGRRGVEEGRGIVAARHRALERRIRRVERVRVDRGVVDHGTHHARCGEMQRGTDDGSGDAETGAGGVGRGKGDPLSLPVRRGERARSRAAQALPSRRRRRVHRLFGPSTERGCAAAMVSQPSRHRSSWRSRRDRNPKGPRAREGHRSRRLAHAMPPGLVRCAGGGSPTPSGEWRKWLR